MKCPHCGAEVPQGDQFCGECGNQVNVVESPTVYAPAAPPGPPVSADVAAPTLGQAKPKRKFPWLIVVLVAVALCIVCSGGGAAVYFFRPTPTATATPTLTPMPTATPTATATATATPTSTPTATPTPTIKTQTFTDQYAGYRVAYPIDWIVVEDSPGESAILGETAMVDDDPASGAFLFCLAESGATDLDTFQQEFVELFVDQDMQLLGSEPVQVGDVAGVALTLQGQPSDASAEIHINVLLAVRGDRSYAFLLGSPVAAMEQNRPAMEIMADSISLFDAVAMPTPPPDREITTLVFASALDDDENPLGETGVYPPGVTEVYVVFEYSGFAGASEFETTFYLDGQDDVSGTLELTGEDTGQTWVRRYNTEGLAPGDYTCEIFVEGQLLAQGGFTVLGGQIALEDDFATQNWSLKDTDVSAIWYEGDQLHVSIKQGGWTAYSTYQSDDGNTFDNVYVEVDGLLLEVPEQGGEYGVVTRRDDTNYYQFLISDSGYFKIRKHDDDGWTTLVDWTENDVIEQGANVVNHLQVLSNGADQLFYVNGVYVGEVTDASLSSGEIGLMAGSYTDGPNVHAVFDDLVLYTIQ